MLFQAALLILTEITIISQLFYYIQWYAIYSYPTFLILILNEFVREPIKLQKQTIPHLKGLICGYLNFEEQACSSIRGRHATFQVKSVLFEKEVAWQPLIELHDSSPQFKQSSIGPFKWGIVFLSIFLGSEAMGAQSWSKQKMADFIR